MSFLRHREIYRSDVANRGGITAAPSLHRCDEFPAGYSSAGCSPAEPACAWPASASMMTYATAGKNLAASGSMSLILLYHRRGALQVKPRKLAPFEFVLDALLPVSPRTRPMFGCIAVYAGPKIVMCLREKSSSPEDNGVWLATTQEHHASLRGEFPNMRSIAVLGKDVTGWQLLPSDADDFETAALRACDLIIAGDPRIGKIPKGKKPKSKTAR